ncbi:MAG: pantoate--beta-alanine ligase [Chitinophagaceae bacterium]|nr:pantoate--beta-alanine ligase [Chitinophagaceae bacterium]
MTIFKKTNDLRFFLTGFTDRTKKTGFVPTMGALHKGHISLITESKKTDDLTVCSIFINPAQFNDPRDFEKYPVTIEKDILMLEQAGCDILFLPLVKEIYPAGSGQDKQYDLGYLETILEGRYRPGHFQAVGMIIDKLLTIIHPNNLYLGGKDYQQCMVIKKLLHQLNLDKTINLKICNTVREADGLAMSSRNMRLNSEERKKASAIFNALELLKLNLEMGSLDLLKEKARNILYENAFRPDYVEIADAANLKIIPNWDGKTKVVGLIAAYMNEVRLIDNMPLN